MYSSNQREDFQKREGEVDVQQGTSSTKKRIDKDDGEYVKFEEVSKDEKD